MFSALAQADVRITMVDTDYQLVELTNFGDASQEVSSWHLCNFPSYMQISNSPAIIGNTNIGANQSVLIHWTALTSNDGELGLYLSTSFNNPLQMVDYFQWGSNNHQREMVAVGAMLWPDDDFLPVGSPYIYIGPLNEIGELVWNSTIEGCTYAEANNFDASATLDNGSCSFDFGASCAGDLNGDSFIDTSDLLAFLGAFGGICP